MHICVNTLAQVGSPVQPDISKPAPGSHDSKVVQLRQLAQQLQVLLTQR